MAANSRIPGKCKARAARPCAVQIVVMVQHPERVQAGNPGFLPLLPVHPPEIDAVLFHRVVQHIKVRFQKRPVRHVKLHRCPACRIDSQHLRHSRIRLLMGAHPIRRMDIQGNLQPLFMEPRQKLRRIREQLPVPGISGPPGSIFRRNIDQMPIHINDCHGKWNLLSLKAHHQPLILLFRISMIPAPPVSKRPPRKQRRIPAQPVKIADTFLIAMAISKEVEIQLNSSAQRNPAVLSNDHGTAVINHSPAVSRNHPVLQRNRTIHLIQRARSSSQILTLVSPAPYTAFSRLWIYDRPYT